MGWTEEQALATDVNAIAIAFRGRQEMFASIFGGATAKGADMTPTMTPGLFKAMFARG
jgi:hypothetical protein